MDLKSEPKTWTWELNLKLEPENLDLEIAVLSQVQVLGSDLRSISKVQLSL